MAAPPRSELQVWIKRERKRPRPGSPKGWGVEELSKRMFDLGYEEAKPGTIQIWEAPKGRDPGADNIEGLERVFGSKAPQTETAPPVGEAGEIAAAIERQTQAIVAAIQARDQTIVDLLSELARYRLQQAGLVETVVAALEQRGTEGRSDDPEPAPRAPVLEPVRQG